MELKEGDEVVLIKKDRYSLKEKNIKIDVGTKGMFIEYCTCVPRHVKLKLENGNYRGESHFVDEDSVRKLPFVEKKFKLSMVR